MEIIIRDDVKYFYGKAIASWMGYSNPNKAVRDHVSPSCKAEFKRESAGGWQTGIFITLAGVYSLVSSNKKGIILEDVLQVIGETENQRVVVVKPRIEHLALDIVDQLQGIKLIRQYPVKVSEDKLFFIDGYDPIGKVAYEIDEKNHKYQQKDDTEREQAIRDYLGCEFVRIKV